MKHPRRKIHIDDYKERIKLLLILMVDMVAVTLAFLLANYIRLDNPFNTGANSGFLVTFFSLMFIYVAVYMFDPPSHNIFNLKPFDEFSDIVKRSLYVVAIVLLILYLFKVSSEFSRKIVLFTWGFGVLFQFFSRIIIKLILASILRVSVHQKRLILLTVSDNADGVIRDFRLMEKNQEYKVKGIVLLDQVGGFQPYEISGIPVIGNFSTMYDKLVVAAVDEVFIQVPHNIDLPLDEMVENFENMGAIVSLDVKMFSPILTKRRGEIRQMGAYQTISYAKNDTNIRMYVVKRLMDLIGGSIGLMLTGIVTVFLAPILLMESPGPLVFSQTRVGKNGRKFKIYKFRSMYQDAEARKVELLAFNEMDGMMFKMENDPRITKVGAFIRKTSIDELPQFWNVVKGDMSLIGTRPPTLDEFEQYKLPYKRRLSMRPGITGMWQVSGRSDIKKFDEVLKLDTEYIDNWSIRMDIKILFKTIWVVFAKSGAN